jgi:hypothetical protein
MLRPVQFRGRQCFEENGKKVCSSLLKPHCLYVFQNVTSALMIEEFQCYSFGVNKILLKNLNGLRVERILFKVSGNRNTKKKCDKQLQKVYNFQQTSSVVKLRRKR